MSVLCAVLGGATRQILVRELMLPLLGLAAGIALVLVVAYKVRTWYADEESQTSAHEMLSDYRQLRDQGELTEDEYRDIVRRLSGEIGGPRVPRPAPPDPPEGAEAS